LHVVFVNALRLAFGPVVFGLGGFALAAILIAFARLAVGSRLVASFAFALSLAFTFPVAFAFAVAFTRGAAFAVAGALRRRTVGAAFLGAAQFLLDALGQVVQAGGAQVI
jgi:hypothetical protein